MTDTDFQVVPPLPPRYRFRDLIWGDHALSDDDRFLSRFLSAEGASEERVRVEFFTNERSFKERLQLYFVKNQRSSLRIRIFNLFIKFLTCVLYAVRVSLDNPHETPRINSTWQHCQNITWVPKIPEEFRRNPEIHWCYIGFVERGETLWAIQVAVAIISLLETLLLTYLGYKGNILQQVLTPGFILEIVNTVPFIVTIAWPPWRDLFVPVFLNCWLAKSALENVFNDLHRVMQKSQSALSQQLTMLCATLVCLCFTSVCGIQHLQRGGNYQIGLFDSLWFVIVTFSTVGYGDLTPDIWPSQLFMMIMIVAALMVLPSQFEQLAYTWLERQKQGGTYSSHRAQTEKHVVVCTTTLHADTVMDFLNEFYAHPKLQDFYVVLLSPCELDPTMKLILQIPIWAQRVIYIQGSALKDSDLARCRMQDAEACFVLAARNYADKTAADEHTIMRSWAVKDFAPTCPQYIQIFRPESKFHVKFAEHVVCEDEFKYALLSNNCLAPGTSTLVTLLLHTSRGQEGQTSNEDWQRVYGRCSGNEIYHINLSDSQFFGEYEGKSFTYASFHAHRKYGVSLVAVHTNLPGSHLQLNPGPRHIMKCTDTCFYMSITKEENSAFILAHPNDKDTRMDKLKPPSADGQQSSVVASMIAGVGTLALELQHTRTAAQQRSTLSESNSNNAIKIDETDDTSDLPDLPRLKLELPRGLTIQSLNKRPSIAPVPALLSLLESNDIEINVESETDDDDLDSTDGSMAWDESSEDYVSGFPPMTPYIGTSPTLCHLMKQKRPLCCLELAITCEHCSFGSAKDYNWSNKVTILAADFASNGLYNFIVPLRSHSRPKTVLNPVVLILERRPELIFLETISYFPMVYWMIGSIDCLDDLLRAGINFADNVVVVNKESSNCQEEDYLSDCNTIVAVQTIFRLFPTTNIITELVQSSNMRFMQFRAKDHYALNLSKVEKREKERGSHISYMFRLPFAAGNVFSACMLDTLLYQAFVKPYLITFVRLLLGVDQAVGSGHLSCMRITKDDMWIRTYGRLYQKLCSTTCAIPIGIYRTITQVSSSDSQISLSLLDDDVQSSSSLSSERNEIGQMVKSRMQTLGLQPSDYDDVSDKRNSISFVIINPNYDLKLEAGDIIYLIMPSSLSSVPSPLIDQRKAMQKAKREDPAGANYDDKDGPYSSCLKSSSVVTPIDGDTQLQVPVQVTMTSGVRGTIV